MFGVQSISIYIHDNRERRSSILRSDASNSNLIKSRLMALTKSHYMQRIQLELSLETSPRDSKYSNSLVDMMKREESTVISNTNSASLNDLSARIDEMLRQETQLYFLKAVEQNIKKWQNLLVKLEKDRTRSKQDAGDSYLKLHLHQSQSQPAVDLDAESKRLEEDYNRNWRKYEEFNLQEAFKAQAARIESDWAMHEAELIREYTEAQSKLTGSTLASTQFSSKEDQWRSHDSHDNRWQHPEKQKTLIHTSPVLTPIRGDLTPSKKPTHRRHLDAAFVSAEVCSQLYSYPDR